MRKFRRSPALPKVKGPRPQKSLSPALKKFRAPKLPKSGLLGAHRARRARKGNALAKFRSRAPKGRQRRQQPQGGPLPEKGSVRPAGQPSAQPEGSQGPQAGQQDQQQSLDALQNAEQEQLVPSAMDRAMSGLAQAAASTRSGERTPGDWKQNPAMMFM